MDKRARPALLMAAALLMLAGCAGGPVGSDDPSVAGSSPSTVAPTQSATSATPTARVSPKATPSQKPTPKAPPKTTTPPERHVAPAGFRRVYSNDRVDVRVTRIKRTTLQRPATAHKVAVGAPIQKISVTVHNKTNAAITTAGRATMTYGTSGHRAAAVRAKGLKGIAASIPPGKSSTGTYGFAVPKNHLYDATLHFRYERHVAPAMFTGSLDYSPGNGTFFNNPSGTHAETLAITTQIERSIDAAPPGSTIRIAHYSFDIEKSAEKIVAAYRRGVHVQMIVDQHNQIVTKQTKTMIRVLGTKKSRKSFIVRCRASCMSNHASAMHAKFYLFSAVGSSRLVSMVSSANITHTNSQTSWNDMQTIVGDPTIYNSLKKYFVDMVPDKNRPHYYRTTTSGPYKLYFFPRASQRRVVLLAALDQVSCTGAAPGYGDKDRHTVVRVMMYSWRGPRIDIAKKLWSLHNQGCTVQIILNSGRTDLAIKSVLTKRSAKYGIIQIGDVWVDRNGNNVAERYMHEKGITINGVWSGRKNVKVVYSGSQNFAPASTTDNNELILRHFSDSTYDAYAKNFRFIRTHGARRLW